jgi:hypothetical protein
VLAYENYPSASTIWTITVHNITGNSNWSIQAYAICAP